MKRIAIYFFYDSAGTVHDYVDYFLTDLSKNTQKIITVVNGSLDEANKKKLLKFGEVIERENHGLDVGAYQEGIRKLGSDLKSYDELILLNNTIMGPLYPFKETFDKMDQNKEIDFWGLTKVGEMQLPPHLLPTAYYGYYPDHIQSHWIAIRSSLFNTMDWEKYWYDMPEITSYDMSVGHHETVFTRYFADLGYKWQVSVDTDHFYPNTIAPIYYIPHLMVKELRCPIFKKRAAFNDLQQYVEQGSGEQNPELFDFIKNQTDYPFELIGPSILPNYHYYDIYKNMANVEILPSEYSVAQKNRLRIAFILHLYFEDLIDDYLAYAKNMPANVDVFVTTSQQHLINQIEEKFSALTNQVKVILVNNRGRDVSALLVGAREIVLNGGYDLICYSHDKKTTQLGNQTVGYSFAHKCNVNIYGTKPYVENVIHLFESDNQLGLAVAPEPNHGDFFWTVQKEWTPDPNNVENTKSLLKRLGVNVPIDGEHQVVAPLGSVFWFRPKAMAKLFQVEWQYEDFPEEPLPVDGTISHAIERSYPFIAQDANYYIKTIMTDKYAAVEYLNLKFYLRQITKKIAAFPPFDQQGTLAGKLGAIELLTDIGNQNKQAVKFNSVKTFLRRVKNYILRKLNKR
ncbi:MULTISPECIES: rhamnan synthesis F family protein [unclassified Enterococcus]|uniref:rhamnan synthesis F family protein n=1 Tax=unclassified Enterococcus TaxID=2608891 RepID=UPI0015572C1F|nr:MULTISPECIES: rhamnan synthesis F family protein [unclassified Enterococcus]MBS7577281.1 rhamnan synthesis protein F [Enterococcus sp. MMGLQ5-2]MBS7584626.1 rhamnan synthesis protein F [Enterococcus sp. MMGLQ5-1]NPD12481.1 rhamnan synthesis protein F [Enterococcus sp. MMGLQ5-1]NPD37115.1 rhamnan synthesis protein F [Enterococcus sp. MMGLQ5-2]